MTALKIAAFSSIVGWAQTMTPLLQKVKTTTNYTNYTDFSLEEIRVICEIRGKASFCSRDIYSHR